MDDLRQQAQHAPGPLELVQRGPLPVELVEHVRVNRVGRFELPPIRPLAASRGEVGLVLRVQAGEPIDDRIPRGELVLVRDGIEQPPPDDLEPLVGAGGSPRGSEALEHVFQRGQGELAVLPADLDLRRRDRRDHQRPLGRLGRLGQRLRERRLRLEVPGGEVAPVDRVARVGHPLVDEHEARRVLLEQRRQHLRARARALGVGIRDELVALGLAELPRHLAPQRPNLGAVGLLRDLADGQVRTHEHGAVRLRGAFDFRGAQDRLQAGELRGRRAAEQVVEGEHRVRLAAAEVGLKLDHRIAALPHQPQQRSGEKLAQPVGDERAPEELRRVGVLGAADAVVDVVQVGGELGLDVAAGDHVLVGRDDLAPRLEPRFRTALDSDGAAGLLPGQFGEHGPLQLDLAGLDLGGRIGGRDRLQEALHGVERPQRIVRGERLFVRPLVSELQ